MHIHVDGFELRARLEAFRYLDRITDGNTRELTFAEIQRGFEFEGRTIRLMGPQGIFKPSQFEILPLSITTAPPKPGKPRPYQDKVRDDGFIEYKYRGDDPGHRDNVGLREAWKRRIPLIYFHGISVGIYIAAYPVFIVGDDPDSLSFAVAVDDVAYVDKLGVDAKDDDPNARRSYITTTTMKRVHQRSFRSRVLQAYKNQCTVCRLKHTELLDAAHILPDSNPRGEPLVTNGLSLCKLHHAAYDRHILGIDPDFIIHIRRDILEETDGPMLRHGLQDTEGTKIITPRSRNLKPNREYLAERFDEFRHAS